MYRSIVGDSSDGICLFPRFPHSLAAKIAENFPLPEEFKENFSKALSLVERSKDKVHVINLRRNYESLHSVFYKLVSLFHSNISESDVKVIKGSMDLTEICNRFNLGRKSIGVLNID